MGTGDWWLGSGGLGHTRSYRRPDYLKHFPALHVVVIRFREPISGPLAIGAGRYGGLGVFAGSVFASECFRST